MEENNKKQIEVTKHIWPDELQAKKKQRRSRIIIVVLMIAVFTGGFFTNYLFINTPASKTTTTTTKEIKTDSKKINDVFDILSSEWYFGKDVKNLQTTLEDNALKGLTTNEIDPHTTYMSAEQMASLKTSLSGSLIGIGIQYYKVGDDLIVEKVYVDSPAEKSGMKEGDIIRKVDGTDIAGMEIEEVRKLILGDEGTQVKIEVARGSDNKKLTMTRAEVSVSAYGYVKDDVGILELSSFSENTAKEVESYLQVFKKEKVKGIVIDVRNNGGGYVQTAIEIASLLIDEGEVVLYQEDKTGKQQALETTGGKKFTFDNIAVLVNEDTASASELLTAALQYHLDAKVIGAKSFGKGTVQRTVEFDDGSALKYTIAEWLTPGKEKIHNKGIKPDYDVALDEAIRYVPTSEDENTYKVDSVGVNVKTAQVYLKFLGYDVDRTDGYFSQKTLDALKAYEQAESMSLNDEINTDVITKLISSVSRKWHDEKVTLDTQMIKAVEVANGK